MEYVTFSEQDKIRYFDELTEMFMGKNFSHITKSDVELLLFHFYINTMINDNKNEDGTIDYSLCSDYKISQDLGITQQRVRNLKVKNQLVNPIPFDWRKALAALIENARYDKKNGKIMINIPDPNLYIEIQNHLENQGKYVEMQLNSKILQIRVEYFIDLVLLLEDEKKRGKIIKELKDRVKDLNKEEKIFEEKEIGKSIFENLGSFLEIANFLTSVANSVFPTLPPLIAALIKIFYSIHS